VSLNFDAVPVFCQVDASGPTAFNAFCRIKHGQPFPFLRGVAAFSAASNHFMKITRAGFEFPVTVFAK
jgi:hypothetical protein